MGLKDIDTPALYYVDKFASAVALPSLTPVCLLKTEVHKGVLPGGSSIYLQAAAAAAVAVAVG